MDNPARLWPLALAYNKPEAFREGPRTPTADSDAVADSGLAADGARGGTWAAYAVALPCDR
eukprot:6794520-Prymnesium_polylepis.1